MPRKEEKNNRVTSLRIDPELWKDVRIAAIKENKSIADFVKEALQVKLTGITNNSAVVQLAKLGLKK